jgi:hypothetical protein
MILARRLRPVSAALLLTALIAPAAQGQPKQAKPTAAPAMSPQSAMRRIGGMITGLFEGSTPGNGLTLEVQSAGSFETSMTSDFRVRSFGSFRGQGEPPRQGILRLEDHGKEVILIYLPVTGDPRAGYLPGGKTMSEQDLSKTCRSELVSVGDGYSGEVKIGSGCQTALPDFKGKWTMELTADSIGFKDASGQLVGFKRKT